MYRDARVGTAHSLRHAVGVVFLGLGCVGLLLPLVPGIPLLIIGGLLLRRSRRHEPRATVAFHDDAQQRTRTPVARLSGFERLQLGFWMFCRAITTRLDRRSQRRC